MTMPVTAHSVAEPSPRSKMIASVVVVTYAVITILPLLWIFLTGFKTPPDSIAYPPKILFEPSVEGYVNLFTTRSRQTPEFLASLPPPQTWYERLVRSRNMVIGGPSKVVPRFVNSMVIGFGSTFLAVCFGTIAAYAFSRFRVPLADDLLFFILSTRMMPPIAVAIPIYLMFRNLGLTDTKLGMILLYTAVNVSLAVWLLKGFMDEIPREYEEAAMVDGYTRLQAFFKVVLPQAATGIAATAIFCLIFAWNEYAFAVLLTSGDAQSQPRRRCFSFRSCASPFCCVAICCAASPLERCANDGQNRTIRIEMAALAPSRPVRGRGDGDDRTWRRDADAARVFESV
jgi:multiple sugar transport system permease protein